MHTHMHTHTHTHAHAHTHTHTRTHTHTHTCTRTHTHTHMHSQVIREDMEMWAESQMWPFSCYSCQREGSCVPGLSDVSPEELRWQFHLEKMTTGGMAAYLETLQKLQDQLLRVRRELVNIHTSDVSALVCWLYTCRYIESLMGGLVYFTV